MNPYIQRLTATAALAVSPFASGEVLIHETFSYPDGILSTKGGWSVNTPGTTNSPVVSNGQLLLASGPGNRQVVVLPFGKRLAPGQKRFFSYDLRVSSFTVPMGLTGLVGPLPSDGAAFVTLLAPTAGGNFRLTVDSAASATGDLQFNTTYKLVVSYDYDTGNSDLWINPASETSEKITSPGRPAQALNKVAFSQQSQVSTQSIDNLIVAGTFAEALTAPAPGTPVQGPAKENYAVIYSGLSELLPAIYPAIEHFYPAFDWADGLPKPSNFRPVGNLTRSSQSRYFGWTPSFDDNLYVGFTVETADLYTLTLDLLEFDSRARSVAGVTAYKWGYRVNAGSGFGPWTFGLTYLAGQPGFASGNKKWDFPDVTVTGTIEFGFFATASKPADVEPFVTEVKLLATGLAPAPVAFPGTLGKYTKVSRHIVDIPEASAVTYNWDNDTLFCIGDEGQALVEITRTGRTLGQMGFQFNVSPRDRRALDDSEGLTYLGDGHVIIADERRNLAVETTYDTAAIRTLPELTPTSYPFGVYDGNTGLEGAAYDPLTESLWGVKEMTPSRLYQLTDFRQPTRAMSEPIHLRYLHRLGITQFSDIFVLGASAAFPEGHPRHENILLLNRAQSWLIEINRAGEIQGVLDVSYFGAQTIEGLTMDDKGNIYLCSEASIEPDYLFVISEAKTAVAGAGRGRQAMLGTAEDDEIYGNPAADVLTGGGGMNTFVFKSLRDGVDMITDFKPAIDTLDLSTLLDSVGYTGANPLTDGQVRILDNAAGAIVQINSNGAYRTLIILQGVSAAQANATNNFHF